MAWKTLAPLCAIYSSYIQQKLAQRCVSALLAQEPTLRLYKKAWRSILSSNNVWNKKLALASFASQQRLMPALLHFWNLYWAYNRDLFTRSLGRFLIVSEDLPNWTSQPNLCYQWRFWQISCDEKVFQFSSTIQRKYYDDCRFKRSSWCTFFWAK